MSLNTNMFDDYDNIPEGYVPNNRPRRFVSRKLDEIVVGGTAIHTFKLTFLYSQMCTRFEVFYQQSITPMLVIDSSALGAPYTITEENGKSYITITLSAAETKKFDPSRETFAQIKLYMVDGSTIFGDINKIIVKPTIED